MQLIDYLFGLHRHKDVMLSLIGQDLRKQYLGSYLGVVWIFLRPLITFCILSFVFSVGFRSQPVVEAPYTFWLLAGLIPWLFIAEALERSSSVIIDHAHLVKKIKFNVEYLPLIRVSSAFLVHVVFLFLLLLIYFLFYPLPIYHYLQIFYLAFASFVFVTVIVYLTSALAVFVRDIRPLMTMVTNFGFWLTPVFWSPEIFPSAIQKIVVFNPAVHLIEGYRNMLIHGLYFWDDLFTLVYFWCFVFAVAAFSSWVFSRLKPLFSDAL